MGRHGSPDGAVGATGAPQSAWEPDAWEAAIGLGGEESLYASGVQAHGGYYEEVNDWSGVYTAMPAAMPMDPAAPAGYFDYESPYAAPQAAQEYYQPSQYSQTSQPLQPSQPDQSYYESVYAAYNQQPVEPIAPAAPVTATWDGPAWQDPYAPASFYGDPQAYVDYTATDYPATGYQTTGYAADEQLYAPPAYDQPMAYPQPPAYEPASFHHPDFDTGQFEAVFAAPGSVEAAYDLLPEGQDGYADDLYDEYDDEYVEDYRAGYRAPSDDDYEYDLDYDEEIQNSADDADYDYDEPEEAPLRSRSRTTTTTRPPVRPARRRTLSTLTSTPAAVVGVAAVAVAAVGGLRLPGHSDTAQADPAAPASGLEQNLLQMRAASADLADRATRSEQRTELSQQQALERQRLAEMAPRYFLPVANYVLTAGFGDSGAHWVSLHTGQDFAVPEGTPVVAVADGTVTDSGYAGAFGNRVVITHPDGSQTWYCHLSFIKIKSGPVKAGQLIAYSGSTGNSTGPHLHFEYHPPGTPDPNTGVPGATTAIDPMPWLRSHGLLP